MDYMLSGEDIKELLGDVEIVRFSDLGNYNKIEDLLPSRRCSVVIFIETESYTRGHWCSLSRDGDSYIWFDSYGMKEKQDYALIPKHTRESLEERNYLKELLQGKRLIQNRVDYQEWKNGVNTCGRMVVIWLYFFKNGGDLKHFNKNMKHNMKRGGFSSFDELSVYLTS